MFSHVEHLSVRQGRQSLAVELSFYLGECRLYRLKLGGVGNIENGPYIQGIVVCLDVTALVDVQLVKVNCQRPLAVILPKLL